MYLLSVENVITMRKVIGLLLLFCLLLLLFILFFKLQPLNAHKYTRNELARLPCIMGPIFKSLFVHFLNFFNLVCNFEI